MDNNKSKKLNLIEFNFLRAIGIFLVVLGHSFPYIDDINSNFYKYIHSLIYSFHMPLFFIISGFFAYKILNINSLNNYKKFIITKFNKLIIPYITISFMTIPIKLILNKFSERSIVLSDVVIDIFFYPWNNPIIFFWFIYTLFIIFVISPIIVKLNKYLIFILLIFLSIFPIKNIEILGISTILKYSIFFFTGLYLRDFYIKNRTKILNFNFDKINFILLVILPLIIFILNINLYLDKGTILSSLILNSFQILKSLLGIYIMFIFCIFLYKFKTTSKLCNILETISYYSFDIYLLSWFPQIFCRIIFYQILNVNYTVVVIISLISGFSPIIFSKFIFRKSKFFKKFILGLN